MPMYHLYYKEEDDCDDVIMSIDRYEEEVEDNDNVQVVLASCPCCKERQKSASLISGTNMKEKVDNGFNDILKSIKTRNPGSTVNDW